MNAYREAYQKRRAYHRPVVTCLGTENDMNPRNGDPPKARWAKCEPVKFEAAHLDAVAEPDTLDAAVEMMAATPKRATERPRPRRLTWQRVAWALAIGSAVGVKVWMWLQP